LLNGTVDAGGTDLVSSSLSYSLGSYLEKLTLTGSSTINGTGNALGNTLTGNAASNVLDGGLGADTLIGGAGNDSYVVDNAGDVVSESTLLNGSIDAGGTDVVNSSVTYALGAFVENLNLTGGSALNATGNTQNNLITGNAAANTLDGGLGADTLTGGAGNDTYVVDDVADRVSEATLLNGTVDAGGVDQINSSVSYALGAFVENLSLTGTSAINGIGNALNNFLSGNAAANTLDGGLGADTLDGGLGADTLIGGAGNDTYMVNDASDAVSESTSLNGSVDAGGVDLVNSSVSYVLGNFVENLILTGDSAINGTGNALNNVITGNAAANTLNGGSGADTLSGGAGNDLYVVDNLADLVSESTVLNGTVDADGVDQVNSSVSYALSGFVENLLLTDTLAINGTGNALNNLITGNAAANVLDGGTGADTLIGGAGNDTYVVDDAADVVSETTAINGTVDSGGLDGVNSSVTFILGSFVENLTLTGTTAINGTGNALNNLITGNTGANTLNGGTGADTMIGGAGNDSYVVDNAGDLVSEATLLNGTVDAGGTDLVSSSMAYSLGSFVENLTLTGSAAINGTGNALNNAITGNSGANRLDGGDGNDTLSGGTGADTMIGGAGNDSYVVDNAGDLVSEATLLNGTVDAGGTDLVSSSLAYTLVSFVENLTLTGTTAINGTGNALSNAITGNSGANRLDGGLGNDTLRGGLGADTLTGGEGSDRFAFAAGDAGTSSGFDVITDYLKGAAGTGDVIDFSSNLVVGGSALTATSTQASINATTGVTTFAAGTGVTLADAVAKINARFVSSTDATGEFALFKVNGAGDFYLYVSDGSTAATDVVVQLVGVSSIGGISINSGDLTLFA
jgi:Ca2+-binding RTX toxin-like protein